MGPPAHGRGARGPAARCARVGAPGAPDGVADRRVAGAPEGAFPHRWMARDASRRRGRDRGADGSRIVRVAAPRGGPRRCAVRRARPDGPCARRHGGAAGRLDRPPGARISAARAAHAADRSDDDDGAGRCLRPARRDGDGAHAARARGGVPAADGHPRRPLEPAPHHEPGGPARAERRAAMLQRPDSRRHAVSLGCFPHALARADLDFGLGPDPDAGVCHHDGG
ncbi:hypothetical protein CAUPRSCDRAFT_12708 [Caulochytrium protostelioides]|uniref:Uncharacterized protein n=1 Tax=Caulochytrium protostelioides TaxID=1555241 RepID=A0A4P9WR83_9FUNG|nr:hypothetical protein CAUPRSCDRAFT_12708 [Caulochytrium protostelioides]